MPSAQKRQRHKEHRRAKVEEELRQYRARRRRQFSILIFLLVAAVAFVLAKTVFKPKPKTTPPRAVPSASGCPTTAPAMSIDPAKKYRATMETSMGTIDIDLDAQRAPQTVNSVVALARCHFYNGLVFHRIIKGFVVQGGDPQGSDPERAGGGGPGYSVTEAPPADLKYDVGTVAMAKAPNEAPGTSGSQFFIVSGPQGASLPPQYALVGKVSSGQDVVSKLEAVPVSSDRPTNPPKIVEVTVVESPGASPAASPAQGSSPSVSASPASPTP